MPVHRVEAIPEKFKKRKARNAVARVRAQQGTAPPSAAVAAAAPVVVREPGFSGSTDAVTLVSALAAIEHVEMHNGPGRAAQARAMLVPVSEPGGDAGIDVAEAVAMHVLHHIDETYPAMWRAVGGSARVSIRNTIIKNSNLFLAALAKEGDA